MDLADLGDVHPEPFAFGAPEPESVEPALGLHELAGQVGAEVAAPLSSALERVNQLATTGQIGRRGLRALREEIEQARRVAMMGQQISRLARGRVAQVRERIDLPQLLRDTLLQRGREIEARGLEVRQVLKPALVSADPALMFTLLQALLDWSFEHCRGRSIQLSTDLRHWPVRPQLQCSFAWQPADLVDADPADRRGGGAEGADSALDSMAWRLVERSAHTMGVSVDRSGAGGQTQVLLEFPQWLDAEASRRGELFDAEDAARLSLNSEPMAGSHVLVVSPRREMRNLVREALRTMGLMVDYVTSTDEAREFCDGGMPHAVIYDGGLADFASLKASLRQEVSRLAFLQIADDAQALEVDSRGLEQEARIGLSAIVASLPSALLYALARAR